LLNHITVRVVAGHPIAGAQYKRLLSGCRDIRLVSDHEKALIGVFDGEIPSMDAALLSALQRFPQLRPLVLAPCGNDAECGRWIRTGAWGLVTYDRYEEDLPRAIHAIAEGRLWFPGPLVLHWVHERGEALGPSPLHFPLTPRENEIVGFLRDGRLSNKEIASSLRITERTVKFHVGNILSKMHVESRRELTRHVGAGSPSA
jgi:DNA-binding NarL/FixJ family response regulator